MTLTPPRPDTAAESPLRPADRAGRGRVNLTDLADRYGSDKGSAKHRYAELYQMLFLPYRRRAIRFLEMGLMIGGPEQGHAPDRRTTDAPSVRMWLEYFPKARIFGLDISDFSWLTDPRFTFLRCDMDARDNIRAAVAGLRAFDIIIDDASHASHHQQNAFLELFARLAPGGLYIIEDLRWQPESYERAGITKTAALFRSYAEGGVFQHADAAVAAECNGLRADISGCFLFQVKFDRTRRDQVVVIHKR